MTWRSIVASVAVPLGALLVMVPLVLDEAHAQRPGDRDRGGDGERGPGVRGGGPGPGGERRKDDWELLGSTRVGGFGVDRDVIDVGRREGRFEKLGLEARDGSVFVLDLIVVYGNDEIERIDLRQHLGEGERAGPIDLKGRGRALKRIEVSARAGRGPGRRAILDVYGERARAENWELLGKQSVGFGVDRDVIRVGRREGRFEKIALEVTENDVQIINLRVFFHRGPPQDVAVREFIRAGGRTRPLDLVGDDRTIDRIELVYRSRPGFGTRGRATIAVYGLQGGGRGDYDGDRGPKWDELGCSKAGFLPDRDVIRVGRQEGRFDAIQLRVSGNKVHILDLRVIYERGPPDDIQVRSEIRDGGETRPLDLRGERNRAIKQVELVYLAQPNFKGSARVCVFGRQGR
ncbi:MAG TPA: hypothetical protein VH852_05320 [Hyphomicrobium sp.]|jgi:hypothetical protein